MAALEKAASQNIRHKLCHYNQNLSLAPDHPPLK